MIYLEKMSYVLGSEHWEKNFKSLLFLVKEYIVDVCEVRKQILYPRLGIWGVSLELMGRGVVSWTNEVNLIVHVNTCSIHFGANSRVCACVCSCVCCSAHGSGCVVDGGSATAAI